jgi:hypothetical protein
MFFTLIMDPVGSGEETYASLESRLEVVATPRIRYRELNIALSLGKTVCLLSFTL